MSLCGIDEAGRGCIAGDLVVAGCVLGEGVEIAGLDDSKKITPKRREALYEQIVERAAFHIVVFSALDVDCLGISECMKQALSQIQMQLKAKRYIFDGNTTFGVENLETMVKADALLKEVSAASILAKVTHDRNILRDAKECPQYGFEKHKGYGTKLHIEMIQKYGYAKLHRKSFRIKALEPTLFS